MAWKYSFSYLEPVCCSMSRSNCIQISQESAGLEFPSLSEFSTVKGFLKLPCFFDDLADFGNLISGSSAFSKSSLNIWKFTVPGKPLLENFEHYFTSV